MPDSPFLIGSAHGAADFVDGVLYENLQLPPPTYEDYKEVAD